MKINWYGTLSAGQGYSGSGEQTAIALERREDTDVTVISFNPVPQINLSAEGRKLKSKPFQFADVALCHGFPASFSSIQNHKFRVGYTMFETDKLPDGNTPWTGKFPTAADAINKQLDLLLVPSTYCVELFRDSGVTIPIEVVPNGVSQEYYSFIDRSDHLTSKKPFTFLMMATLTTRKNPGMVISAFSSLFRDNKDARLILKTQSGTLGHMQFNEDMGDITVIDQAYKMDDMKKLMAEADCFVFPSRGEGFGMPPIEAMATGLPTIVAKNTGMIDYCDERYNYFVEKNVKTPANRYPTKWGDVGNWYEPDYQEFKGLMKHVYENQDEAREKGKLAAQWMKEEWNYDVIAQKIVDAVNKHYKG